MAETYTPLLQSDPCYYGGIVVGPRIQPAINYQLEDSGSSSSSRESWATASETSIELQPATGLKQPQGPGYTDTETPGQPAPSRHGSVDLPIEQGRVTCGECCKCCKSWDDWCLFLSCNCLSSFALPMNERKSLRAARTEGWRLLWSFLLPLTVRSLPLHLIWLIAQIAAASTALLVLLNTDYIVINCCFYISCTDFPWSNYNNNYVISLVCLIVWFTFSCVDILICIAMSRFHRSKLVIKFRVYITPFRILYSFLCLLTLTFSNYYFLVKCTDQIDCTSRWCASKGMLYTSITFLFLFVDFVCLVIAVLFALNSLKVRNAYSQAIGGPGKREGIRSFECYFVLCVLGEVVMHVVLILFACSVAFTGPINVNFGPDTLCGKYLKTSSVLSAILSLIVPVVGIVSIYYNNYFHFQKYFINVYLSICHISQDRERAAQLGIPADVYENLQVRQLETQHNNYTASYLENFVKEFRWSARLTHPCFCPIAIISSTIAYSMLITYISVNSTNYLSEYASANSTHYLLEYGNDGSDGCTRLLLVQLISITVIFCLIHLHTFFTFFFVFLCFVFGCCLGVVFPIPCIILCCCCYRSSTCRCNNYVDSIP